MLITPDDVISYSVFEQVKSRDTKLLEQDILEAEIEVRRIAGHDFSAPEYTPLPAEVKLALQKLAQYYALVNSDESLSKGIKSEKIGDYSYTASEGSGNAKPDVSALLSAFIKKDEPADPGTARMRLRSL
ncbi:DUF3199 family protein [Bacillus sp. REN10]|uniref:protein YqbG n=1 Tax=Bacillus sp. REN10 TaxID=2782541 RepID=UPI00193B8D3E|nr:DUF3199 family protein [Bacillus sp. REN10]